jgi:phosphoglycolate phosphatase-like HAD superfamily hydrolase
MIREALAEHESLWRRERVLFVGDRPEDQAAAKDADVSFE